MKAGEENGEEAEPLRNGAESISEGEGGDANSGSTDSSGDGTTFPFKAGTWASDSLGLSLSSCAVLRKCLHRDSLMTEAHHRGRFTGQIP